MKTRNSATGDGIDLILGALGWMKKCFGPIQEMMVDMCIWKLTHNSPVAFSTQDVVNDLSIPYSTATRLLRIWAERGVIAASVNHSDDGRASGHQQTPRGITLGDILRQWNQGEDVWNTLPTARWLKDAGGFPAHGNQPEVWDAGCHTDFHSPEHKR